MLFDIEMLPRPEKLTGARQNFVTTELTKHLSTPFAVKETLEEAIELCKGLVEQHGLENLHIIHAVNSGSAKGYRVFNDPLGMAFFWLHITQEWYDKQLARFGNEPADACMTDSARILRNYYHLFDGRASGTYHVWKYQADGTLEVV